ncbi:Nif11-like leader peptide family natural product precursor [Desulfosarcina ovata]|uniref:Nif11 domain-containing protein n=2 Tax=Desulfosarcina ovata TaxID=83564 RepID=A0A5K8A5H9_9BACT|nr:Nif11-like leader peptide family natural product precursor [Desulfosarcina ovata]BBO80651.1 hypothetical protein DSCO28_12170 [Desulfosarcina ovata subsp. sediminis]BBO87863.1 hypothetical protein DSCOOX_10430 [Desulfosarcina ovata subsp. ovata]
MTIGNALKFIKRGMTDKGLRARLNAATSVQAVEEILIEENIPFSTHDFDEAFHHQLTLCQEEEEADQLKEFRMWWTLLFQLIEPAACPSGCGGCNP